MQIVNIPTLPFDDLGLRNTRSSDAGAWYAYLKNPDVVRHTSWNLEAADDLLPQLTIFEADAVNSSIRLAIVRKADDLLVGTVGFHTMSDLNRSAELAYDLAPEYWGRRIMPAAAKAMCDWGFSEGRLNRIQATVLESNASSIKVLERLGFQREGYLRSETVCDGKPMDMILMAALCDI